MEYCDVLIFFNAYFCIEIKTHFQNNFIFNMKQKILNLFLLSVFFWGCHKDDGAIDVIIQNKSFERIAVKLTDTRWVAIGVGSSYRFNDYFGLVNEDTDVFIFTDYESQSAMANLINCYSDCFDEKIKPPYGGGVIKKTFNLKRSRKKNLDGTEHIPTITILAEKINTDSLLTGDFDDRDVSKIRLRILE